MQPLDAAVAGRKILILISSMNAGGAERVVATLANNWVRLGHEVRIVPCFAQGTGQSFYPLDERIDLHWLAQDLPQSKLLARLLKPLVLRRLLKQWQADVVVSFLTNVNVTALLATLGLTQPVIVCERTDPLSESHLPLILRKLRKVLYPKAAAVMLQTQAAASDYAALNPAIKQVPTIANPLSDALVAELSASASAQARPEVSQSQPKVLLAMGRLVPIKQYAFLIDCFAAVAKNFTEWQLHIYGSGPLAESLQAQIDELGLSTQVLLKGATKTPWQCMRAADAFVMTSEREGFPNVLLEAMANGLASIAIDCPYGPAEVSQGGNLALLVPFSKNSAGHYDHSTQAAFIDALRQLLANDTLRQRLAVEGQAFVLKEYATERILQHWEALFQTLGIKSSVTAQSPAPKGLKVLHLISGLGHGGAETVLQRLVTHAKKDRHCVLSMQDEGVIGPALRAAGIELHCLNMPPGNMSIGDFMRLRKTLKQLAPDVVQCWMYHADMVGGLAARLAGIRTVLWGVRNSGDNLASSSRSSYILARYFAWTSYLIPRLIVVCAELAAQRHRAWGYQAAKIRVIPNGYDLSRWQPASPAHKKAMREQLGLAIEDEVIGFVARWNPLKNHANLIQAMAHLQAQRPGLKLLLIGEGLDSSNAELMALLAEAQLVVGQQVLLLGRRDDVPALMPILDLHVLASLAEGFPNVVAEAMACEVPNVVTNVGDAAFIVGEVGWVVPPRDAAALAQGIDQALTFLTCAEAAQFKRQCRQRVLDNFSLPKMVQAYEAVWREAIDK
ncbi:GDP-mannose-dependent alpha-(1-6)-phosphatidylinositol monomannoside mannosyltransferase [Oligella urethralis]|uniref:glycosyltransferase n=1 Tax=Oligella urethralis TaxID=90245 RepID=UPI000DFBC388|nr:glycosyltransferase [Oligella urethralis]SUA66089.1 GDP-mannose-dependent alpha-(1-6)-phosphatidylinositol monomannoside mannosyltransferase [Oligella urethralis]